MRYDKCRSFTLWLVYRERESPLIAKSHTECEVVCLDDIREEVFGDASCQQDGNYIFLIGKARILNALKAGKDVIFDATNLTPKYRKWCLGTNPEHIAVFLNTRLKECLKRNSERERIVPPEVIERSHKRLVPPTTGEGFDKVIIL